MGKDGRDIDLTKIDFPTDRLTIKDWRRMFSDDFDSRDITPSYVPALDKLAELLTGERLLAISLYEEARGIEGDEFALRGDDLKESVDELGDDYLKFGLATGPAQARELARSVERQALQQAARHGGKAR